jgi:hypothetical protein
METDTQLDTQPETKSETPSETKRCQRCRKTFAIERFIDLDKDPDKVYAKCIDCRLKLINRRNYCSVCGIRGCFNFPGESFGRRCKKHSDIGMVNVLDPKCFCGKSRPNFNIERQPALYCKECKSYDMIDVKHLLCECKKVRPTFNLDGQPPRYCQECKTPNMIDVSNKKCKCGKSQPSFNILGQPAMYCGECKSSEMIDVKSKKCKCGRSQPIFNTEGMLFAEYCKFCKSDDMVDVINKKCKCGKARANFNLDGQPAEYCQSCKSNDMIDVVHRLCECGRVSPSFNVVGQPARYCKECKTPDMINVVSKKCFCGKSLPNFNIEGQPALYCQECKSPEMIDVKHQKCFCGTRAYYGLPGMIPEKCAKHKSTGMINPPRKQCEADDCKEFATHGIKGPVHCENHAQTDEYLLTERNCLKCNRLDILNAQGLCVNFCSLEERDRLMKKRTKKKEEFVRKLLEKEIDLKEYVIQEWQDSTIDPTCTKRRPDFVYHCGDHIVIIEVDEDQHKSYSNCGSTREEKLAGENRRMFEIFQIFQGLPVVFLRYNPDGFRVNQKTMKVSDRIRHRILVQWIKKCLREFQPGLLVKYLYYDDFNETDIGLIQIQEKDVLV